MNKKKQFISFLKEHKIYYNFISYFISGSNLNYNTTTLIEYIKILQDEGDEEEAINYAFTWSNTKEGEQFWNNIHNKWLNLLDNK